MQKRLLAVAVAGVLAAPAAAMAQSSVTVSGALNLWLESAGASGATQTPAGAVPTTFDVKSRSRIQDGNGSNVRFTAVEDLGGGMQAFGQVESAVFNNADTRANAVGTAGVTGGWGTRNSGVGLRGSSWGEVLLGIWDVHYNEQYAVDNSILKGASHTSTLGLLNTFGTAGTGAGGAGNAVIGARYSNVLRYQSPNWSGFNVKGSYSRPSDPVVPTAGGVVDGTKNTALNIAPQYSNGPIFVGFSYLDDKDINYGGTTALAGVAIPGGLMEIKSNRLSGSYAFPFGLKLGLVYDSSKMTTKVTSPGVGSELKRNVWAVPISFATGAHTVFATYAKASKVKGTIGGTDLSLLAPATPAGGTPIAATLDSDTGASYINLGYQFDLSKRTTLHASWTQITNQKLASYDMFANGVGMASANYGADPRIISLGLRHAF